MAHAWLDSLSEDWVSEPRSPGSLPSLHSNRSSVVELPKEKEAERGVNNSRIPVYKNAFKSSKSVAGRSDAAAPLAEWNTNDSNRSSMRAAAWRLSKFREEEDTGSVAIRGRQAAATARSISELSCSSVQRHAVDQRSLSSSPAKAQGDTPEWRRRLVYGEVGYGEQCDLFGPSGLENMFKPPAPGTGESSPPNKRTSGVFGRSDSIMPSSPPLYRPFFNFQDDIEPTMTLDDLEVGEEQQSIRRPNQMKYRLQRSTSDPLSEMGSEVASVRSRPNIVVSKLLGDSQISPRSGGIQTLQKDRLASGGSAAEHESLSPIYLSLSTDEMKKKAEQRAETEELEHKLRALSVDEFAESYDSSSTNLAAGASTQSDMPNVGNFVNVRRGGRSHEGSFQRRMLSPSSLPPIDESRLTDDERQQNVSFAQSVDSEYHLSPETPNRSKPGTADGKSSSGSPLKLFGQYDTFTEEKLQRRLSQFEMEHEDEEEDFDDMALAAPSNFLRSRRNSRPSTRGSRRRSVNPPLSVRGFGQGQLEGFQFSDNVSIPSEPNTLLHPEDAVTSSRPRHGSAFKFNLTPVSDGSESAASQRRKKSGKLRVITPKHTLRHTSTNSRKMSVISAELLETPRKPYRDQAGKRMQKSPGKSSTPKRRRTLHESDISHEDLPSDAAEKIQASHAEMQSIMGKKRKDTRSSSSQKVTDPDVVALRQVLHSRPTSSHTQGSSHTRRSNSFSDRHPYIDEEAMDEEDFALARVELGSSTSLPLGPTGMQSRKGSVTTQDFLDEARQIMANIRSKARSHPHSALTSIGESESEDPIAAHDDEDDYQDTVSSWASSVEPLSRPPSREGGGPLARLPRMQSDPKLLSHLKKYEEVGDIGDAIQSLRTLGLSQEADDLERRMELAAGESSRRSSRDYHNETVECDPPNIRITRYPELQRKRRHSNSSGNELDDSQEQRYNSNRSSGNFTTRSMNTTSSRSSESRRVIAPHAVSHLIPEQLAGMVFDKSRKVWVKAQDRQVNHIEDEEDPFGDIPDLTVDEIQELSRLSPMKTSQSIQDYETDVEDALSEDEMQSERPVSRDHITDDDDDEFEEEAGDNADQGSVIYRRPSDPEPFPDLPEDGLVDDLDLEKESPDDADIDDEISIHESRIGDDVRRGIAISFSSPLAEVIGDVDYGIEMQEQDSVLDDDGHEKQNERPKSAGGRSSKTKTFIQSTPSRRMTFAGHSFRMRPVSRIDEVDEDSTMPEAHHHRSISLVVSTPLTNRSAPMTVQSSAARSTYSSLMSLTPLSDFTLHQKDPTLVLRAPSALTPHGRDGKGKCLSLSVKELVKHLTDVEPHEPFWEYIKQLDLRERGLLNVHMLNEFCGSLEELDVSHNQLDQLDGAPSSIRALAISHNILNDLTSWGHLMNLQYIDVSHNELTSLRGFNKLVHLRSLKAEHNQIRSLDGVLQLDGLLSLKLRGNQLERVNFENSSLQRLTELDLKENDLREIRYLHELSSLSTLNLEDNELDSFALDTTERFTSLRYLKISGNRLTQIDVSQLTSLRLLYLDRNRLGKIQGLLKAKYLDSLSLREQDGTLDMSFLDSACEVRKLFLSGNRISHINPSVDFLNLQYLEMANCGLESLPEEFGQIMCNIRVLNLNYNAIKDIGPLYGIVRLKKLLLASNRLITIHSTADVLRNIPNLAKLDLRSNPLTLGFYPAIIEQRIIKAGEDESEDAHSSKFTLPNADRDRDNTYASRLDMDARLRRRLYEMMLHCCKSLRMLDGLNMSSSGVMVQDEVWQILSNAGIIDTIMAEAETEREKLLAEGKVRTGAQEGA